MKLKKFKNFESNIFHLHEMMNEIRTNMPLSTYNNKLTFTTFGSRYGHNYSTRYFSNAIKKSSLGIQIDLSENTNEEKLEVIDTFNYFEIFAAGYYSYSKLDLEKISYTDSIILKMDIDPSTISNEDYLKFQEINNDLDSYSTKLGYILNSKLDINNYLKETIDSDDIELHSILYIEEELEELLDEEGIEYEDDDDIKWDIIHIYEELYLREMYEIFIKKFSSEILDETGLEILLDDKKISEYNFDLLTLDTKVTFQLAYIDMPFKPNSNISEIIKDSDYIGIDGEVYDFSNVLKEIKVEIPEINISVYDAFSEYKKYENN